MKNWKMGLTIASMMAFGAACGGNNGTNNGTNNGGTNNGGTNNGQSNNGTVAPNNGTGGSNNGTVAPNNGTAGTNNGTTVANNGTTVPAPPTCADANPPARCSEDPTTKTDWAPTSIINQLIIEGTEDDPVCCFDYTGDGEIDNALGQDVGGLIGLDAINDNIATSIDDGSLVLLLEHAGLDDATTDDDFLINFFIGSHVEPFDGLEATNNQVLIDPASFDMGSQPQAYVPDASVTGGAVAAGPGTVKIQISLAAATLDVTVSQARIEADVDAANSALDATGVSLSGGKLGGVVKVRDVFTAANEFAANSCTCLGLTQPLLDDNGMCPEDGGDVTACEDAMEDTCATVGENCGLFGAVSIFADVDLDGDGAAGTIDDGLSLGASFTTAGAEITGVEQ